MAGYQILYNGKIVSRTTSTNFATKTASGYSVLPVVDLSTYLKIQNVLAGTNVTLVKSLTGVTINAAGGSSGNFVSASTFTHYTGTTAPATYLSKTAFNSYSGLTLTNINSRLLASAFNSYSGSTLTNINSRLLTSSFNSYSGTTLANINSRLLKSAFNVYSGLTNTRLSTVESLYVTGATNGLALIGKKIGLNSVYGVSTLNADTFLDGYFNLWIGTVVPLQTFQMVVSNSTGFTGSYSNIYQTPTDIAISTSINAGSHQPGLIDLNSSGVNILGGGTSQLFIGDESVTSHNSFFNDQRTTVLAP